jgi:hypothetical protein
LEAVANRHLVKPIALAALEKAFESVARRGLQARDAALFSRAAPRP